MSTTNVGQVLGALRQAAREIGGDPSPDTEAASWPAPSSKQVLLQVSALHKGFNALTEALLEISEASRQQSASWDGSLAAVRREFMERLELMHSDLQQVFALDAGAQAQSSLLADRVAGLEDQAASIQAQVEQQNAETERAIQNAVTQAANAQFEEHVSHFEQERVQPLVEAALQQQAEQWAATRLAGLVQEEVRQQATVAVQAAATQQLQEMQRGVDAAHEACASTAELASQLAADLATLAADVQHLSDWCSRIDAAHANHEQRLRRLEAGRAELAHATAGAAATTGAAAPSADAVPSAGGPHSDALPHVAAALLQQEERLSWLESAVQSGSLGALPPLYSTLAAAATLEPPGNAAPLAPAAGAEAGQGAQQGQQGQQQQQGEGRHESVAHLQAQLGAVQRQLEQRLAELEARQAQQAEHADETMHSMLTDVMALARHCKALDAEVRRLRGVVEQVQVAVQQCGGVVAGARSMPLPLGPGGGLSEEY